MLGWHASIIAVYPACDSPSLLAVIITMVLTMRLLKSVSLSEAEQGLPAKVSRCCVLLLFCQARRQYCKGAVHLSWVVIAMNVTQRRVCLSITTQLQAISTDVFVPLSDSLTKLGWASQRQVTAGSANVIDCKVSTADQR